jgi:hypothetical protein
MTLVFLFDSGASPDAYARSREQPLLRRCNLSIDRRLINPQSEIRHSRTMAPSRRRFLKPTAPCSPPRRFSTPEPAKDRPTGLRRGAHRSLVSGKRTGSRVGRKRHLRAGCSHRVAYPTARPGPHCHSRLRLGATRGRSDRGDPPSDVVWVPPSEKHWHGATPTTMRHIAIRR